MIGILFAKHEVEIDPKSVKCGGSWYVPAKETNAVAYDSPLVGFFYNRMMEIPHPYILDIGASTGSFCLLAKLHPHAKVWAFEPNPHICGMLHNNVALNHLEEQVKVCNFALTNQCGQAVLKVPVEKNRSGISCLGTPVRFHRWNEITVETHRLDNIKDTLGITRIDLIKIDTEGCELFVLKGGEHLIREFKPGIILEYNPRSTKQFGYHPEESIKLLKRWGYRKFTMAGLEDFWATP